MGASDGQSSSRRESKMDRRQETATVRRALTEAGIPVLRIQHGTGTAWGWLTIYLDGDHRPCDEICKRATAIALQVTGRYDDGRTNAY
jgi:hypothetical protein